MQYSKNISVNGLNRLAAMILASSLGASSLTGCSSSTSGSVTDSDRKQLLIVSSEQVNQLSAKSYQDMLAQANAHHALDTDPAMLARLKGIANRIIPQTLMYRKDTAGWPWEVHILKTDELNAAAMPGGKIFFNTGIVERLKLTDDEIATIMGHEIAHAVREHTRERMSQEVAKQAGIGVISNTVGLSDTTVKAINMASHLGLDLPHDRKQESEADTLGLELMARGGYNPQAALTLWNKMQQASQGEPFKFLSNHPATADRITHIQAIIPEVMPLYVQAKQAEERQPTGQPNSTQALPGSIR